MIHRKYIPPMVLLRLVAREELHCSWCRYPIALFCAVYALMVGERALGPAFCSDRCGEIEARVRGRGPVEAR